MTGNLERQVSRLEEEASPCRQGIVWRERGQTAHQAIAARFSGGMTAGVEPMVVGWME